MARLYRQHVLKEQAAPEAPVQIMGLGGKPKASPAPTVPEEPVAH
jgi:hypothetical protein